MSRSDANVACLALICSRKIQRSEVIRIIENGVLGSLHSPEEVTSALDIDASELDDFRQAWDVAMEIKEYTERNGIEIIKYGDPSYPELLKEIPTPPAILFVRGSIELRDRSAVAIVGARKASIHGRKIAFDLSRALSASGLTIVSGLARGIDTASHLGALSSGGRTIAVLGCGIDRVYPPENASLAENIQASGAVISEFLPGTPPLRENFPQRNRLIAGLGMGTIVVEAGEASGALITANFALEFNRSVFAVPGTPGFRGSVGTNSLLKQGARLVEGPEDVLEEICPQIRWKGQLKLSSNEVSMSELEATLLESLSNMPTHIDEICEEVKLEPAMLLGILLSLEAKGLVKSLPGKFYIRL